MARVRGVAVEVETADALAVGADVLVLKHAQASYGVDAVAKQQLGLDSEMTLLPGHQLVIRNPEQIGARNVVFLGVPPLSDFGYPEIRLFGRRAVSLVASGFPECQHLALTLHGVGYGLDETACFAEEVRGIVDALGGGSTSDLRLISIVETDERRTERLRGRLEDILVESSLPEDSIEIASPRRGFERTPPIGATAPDAQKHAFVAMPFAQDFQDIFHYAIEPAVHASGLLCERIDEQAFTGSIPERIKERIRSATLVVADLTDANPNVYLEVGFAWGAEVPTVLLCHDRSDLKFDVQTERCIGYSTIRDLELRLTDELRRLAE